MTDTIEQFIKQLETEIRETEVDEARAEQLLRLQKAAENYQGEDRVVSSHEIAERLKHQPPLNSMATGFPELDAIIGGLFEKQLVVMSAATKSGKTSFCVDMTTRMRKQNPLWLPFEETAEELIQRFVDRGDDVPLFYTPGRMVGNTMVWLEKKIIEAKAKYDSKVVFIDHLHFIVELKSKRLDTDIGIAMRSLKQMARTWGVAIVIIAHLKKTKVETQPDLEDLRDSSFVAQEADTVIMLWREAHRRSGEVEITNNVNVSVQANRRTGKTGNIRMVFENGYFRPATPEDDLESLDQSADEDNAWRSNRRRR